MLTLGIGRQKNLTAPRRQCLVPRDTKNHRLAPPICFARLDKLDNQLLRMDLDARNVDVDEAPVVNRLRWLEMVSNRPLPPGSRSRLPALGGIDPARSGCAVEQGGREIVPILDAPLAGMARAHAIAAVIEDAASQQSLGPASLWLCNCSLVHSASLEQRRTGPDRQWRVARLSRPHP